MKWTGCGPEHTETITALALQSLLRDIRASVRSPVDKMGPSLPGSRQSADIKKTSEIVAERVIRRLRRSCHFISRLSTVNASVHVAECLLLIQ